MVKSEKTGRELKPQRGQKGGPMLRRFYSWFGITPAREQDDDQS